MFFSEDLSFIFKFFKIDLDLFISHQICIFEMLFDDKLEILNNIFLLLNAFSEIYERVVKIKIL